MAGSVREKVYRDGGAAASAIGTISGMPSAQASTSIVCSGGPLSAVETDLLVVPWFQDEGASAVAGLDAASLGELARALTSKEFQAKPYDLFLTPIADRAWKARRLALVGGGAGERGTDLVRKLATAAGLAARGRRVGRVAFVVRGHGDRRRSRRRLPKD